MNNREIKFRAWNAKSKQWLMGYEMPNLGGFSLFGEMMLLGEWSALLNEFLFDRNGHKADDLIVMQLTGLKDKNGKEIYEGDIIGYVRAENDRDWLKGHDGIENKLAARSGIVEFKDGKFVLHWHYGDTYDVMTKPIKIRWTDEYNDLLDELDARKNPIVEVIGNIYENPDNLDPSYPSFH